MNHKPDLSILALFVMLSFVVLAMSSPARAGSIELIDKFDSLHRAIENSDDENSLPKLWALIDEAVLDHLNTGKDINSLPQLFSRLAGYHEPKTAKRTVIGTAFFTTNRTKRQRTGLKHCMKDLHGMCSESILLSTTVSLGCILEG